MAKWKAPEHISGVDISTGHLRVKDGIVTTADDLADGDRTGLASAGFTPIPEAAAPAKAVSADKAG